MAKMPLHLLSSRYVLGASVAGLAMVMLGACTGPDLSIESVTLEKVQPSTPLVYPAGPARARFIHEATIVGSADIVEETGSDRFKEFATGYGRKTEGFGKPFGIVARHGRLYVSDTVRRMVHVMDRGGGTYFQLGTEDVGRLSKPLGLAVDDSGKIYVCDGTTRRVMVFGPGGEFLTAIGGPEHLRRPSSVTVSPDGARIYVVDTGGIDTKEHRVVVFDSGGSKIRSFGSRGSGRGQFNLPLAIERADNGDLVVLDTGNFRVQRFNANGAALSSFGKAGRYPGQFGHPKDVALDRDGNIYVTDPSFGVFQIFSPSGRILLSVGERNETGGRGRFLLPAGIDIDADGRVYVVDQYFRKIEVFRPADLPESTPLGGRAASQRVDVAQ